MTSVFKRSDMFGASVPGLNMNGRDSIQTVPGAIISIMIMVVTGLFAVLKLQYMLMRKSPDVVEVVDITAFDLSDKFDTAQDDFMMAVSAERHQKGARMDPRYVQWVVTLIKSTPDSFESIYVPMQPCTDE